MSHVRSMRTAGGMPLRISYSARAVADALLSSTSRANGLRLLRSTCVSMQLLDGAAPTRTDLRSTRRLSAVWDGGGRYVSRSLDANHRPRLGSRDTFLG